MKKTLIILALAVIFVLLSSSQMISADTGSYVINGDTVYVNVSGKGLISQTPHTLNQFINTPLVNFTSFNAGTFDFAFVFNTTITKPTGALLLMNVSHNVPTYGNNTWFNYTCDYKFNYTVDPVPKWAWCYYDAGNYTAIVFDHSYEKGNVSSRTIFWQDYGVNGSVPEFWFEWVDVHDSFGSTVLGGKTYYYVQNVSFLANETKSLMPTITVSPGLKVSGKYDIMIKNSSVSLQDALANNNYWSIDPWWNAAYSRCRNINIGGGNDSYNYTNWPIGNLWVETGFNLTGLTGKFLNGSDVAIVNASCDDNNAMQLPMQIISQNSDWAYVSFAYNKSAGVNTTYSVYYDADTIGANTSWTGIVSNRTWVSTAGGFKVQHSGQQFQSGWFQFNNTFYQDRGNYGAFSVFWSLQGGPTGANWGSGTTYNDTSASFNINGTLLTMTNHTQLIAWQVGSLVENHTVLNTYWNSFNCMRRVMRINDSRKTSVNTYGFNIIMTHFNGSGIKMSPTAGANYTAAKNLSSKYTGTQHNSPTVGDGWWGTINYSNKPNQGLGFFFNFTNTRDKDLAQLDIWGSTWGFNNRWGNKYTTAENFSLDGGNYTVFVCGVSPVAGQNYNDSLEVQYDKLMNLPYATLGAEQSNAPNVSLVSPLSNNVNNSRVVKFQYIAVDSGGLINCSLWTNETSWSAKHSNGSTSITTGVVSNISESFTSDGSFLWNVECYDLAGNVNVSMYNWTVKVDTVAPPAITQFVVSIFMGNSWGTNLTSSNTSQSSWCYQEFANQTSCGNLDTGRNGDTSAFFDGSWATSVVSSSGALKKYVNYSKAALGINTTVWMVKDITGFVNLSVPSQCWEAGDTIIGLRSVSTIAGGANSTGWECHNNSADWTDNMNNWKELRFNLNSNPLLYEEALFFNITSNQTSNYASGDIEFNASALFDYNVQARAVGGTAAQNSSSCILRYCNIGTETIAPLSMNLSDSTTCVSGSVVLSGGTTFTTQNTVLTTNMVTISASLASGNCVDWCMNASFNGCSAGSSSTDLQSAG